MFGSVPLKYFAKILHGLRGIQTASKPNLRIHTSLILSVYLMVVFQMHVINRVINL